MGDGIVQAILEFGVAKCIGAVAIVAFFFYSITSVKHNNSSSGTSSSSSSTPVDTQDTSGTGGA